MSEQRNGDRKSTNAARNFLSRHRCAFNAGRGSETAAGGSKGRQLEWGGGRGGRDSSMSESVLAIKMSQ